MLIENRMVVISGYNDRGGYEVFWDANTTLFLDLSANDTGVSTLWKFIGLYIYDLCTYMYILTSSLLKDTCIKRKLEGRLDSERKVVFYWDNWGVVDS